MPKDPFLEKFNQKYRMMQENWHKLSAEEKAQTNKVIEIEEKAEIQNFLGEIEFKEDLKKLLDKEDKSKKSHTSKEAEKTPSPRSK